MKRSEMVGLISKLIRLYRFDNVNDDEAADRLLKVIQEEGMLPPFTYLKNLGTLDTAWEPESDE
jgi:hypothetical protein